MSNAPDVTPAVAFEFPLVRCPVPVKSKYRLYVLFNPPATTFEPPSWKSVIDKQIAIYAKAGMDADVRKLEDERRVVERLEQGSPRRSA